MFLNLSNMAGIYNISKILAVALAMTSFQNGYILIEIIM